MLLRYDPMRQLERLASALVDEGTMPTSMPMDAYRQGDDLVVHLDLPGVESSDIELTVEHDVLNVTARRQFDRADADALLTSERPQGVFSRRILLGEGMDLDHMQADHANGVLTIRVPVSETARPRRVPISVGDRQREIEAEAVSDTADAEKGEAVRA